MQKRGRIGAVGSWMGGYYALAVGWCQTASERVDLLTAFNAKVQIEVPGFNRREDLEVASKKVYPRQSHGILNFTQNCTIPLVTFYL